MRIRALVAAIGVVALVGVACDNEDSGGGSSSSDSDGGSRPGVTDTQIKVGGVVSETNLIGQPYEDTQRGVELYFEKINDEGGVHGLELNSIGYTDDQSNANANVAANRALVEEEKVFAVIPEATSTFTGAQYLAQQGTPTFGWNINAEWSEGPNLFGEKGSYLCFECPSVPASVIATEVGADTAAVFAYGGIPQSEDCAVGTVNGLENYDIEVIQDTSLSYGFTDTSAAIAAVRDNDVGLLTTCMDINGTATLAADMKDAGLDIAVYSPQGYDYEVLADLGEQMEGFYFQAAFWPFELENPPEGMQDFLDAVEADGREPSEFLLVGWLNAALLVQGIEDAGEDFSQESVIEAINSMTEPYTAGGILSPTLIWGNTDDYPEGAHGPALNGTACSAFVQVQDGEFVSVFGEEGKPFVCFEGNNEVDQTGVPSIDDPIYLPE
jgi:branched-chain amino acid transport system substrate-binding protein